MVGADREHCTGCGACAQKCPKSCIRMVEGEFGFLYPEVDTNVCVGCGLCERICPINRTTAEAPQQKAFAVVHRDAGLLSGSASGGAFPALADWVLQRGGAVYGCAYDEDFYPRTIRIDSRAELPRLQGSKYVQCNTGDSFLAAGRDLKEGRYVLFSGTPCQIAGLRAYLGREYEKLICADLICHGVPSARYFHQYLEHLQRKEDCRLTSFSFRSKHSSGWSLSGLYSGVSNKTGKPFSKDLHYFDSYYYSYFLSGETYRESCYSCQYANLKRPGDFTMGDLWGVEGMKLPFRTNCGCSLLLANTAKANAILSELDIYCQEITLEEAVQYNHQLKSPSKRSPRRAERQREYEQDSPETMEQCFRKTHWRKNLIGRLKYACPDALRHLLLKWRYSRKH